MLLDYIKEKTPDQQVLADKAGFERSNVNRMLNADYSPTLDNFLKLCEASSCYVFIIDKEADEDTATLMRERWGKENKN